MRRGDDWFAMMVILEKGAARYGRRIVIYLGGSTVRARERRDNFTF